MANWQKTISFVWSAGWVGALLAGLLGVGLLVFPVVPALTHWSYDWLFLLRGRVNANEVVLIYMDEISHTRLNQPSTAAWDRGLHARLVHRLRAGAARAIVFDILFQGPDKNPAADAALAEAIREHGQVVLGASLQQGDHYRLARQIGIVLPHAPLLAAATNWGTAALLQDADGAVRQHLHGSVVEPTLAWATARLLGAEVTRAARAQERRHWLNYYQPAGGLRSVSYYQVLENSDAELARQVRGKVVFVGAATQTGFSGGLMDYFRTPYTGMTGHWAPGIDVHATMLLNLLRGDWLERLPPWVELGVVLFCGAGFGLTLPLLRPRLAVLAALGGALLVTGATVLLFALLHAWFAWLIVCAVQIPAAWMCSLVRHAEYGAVAAERTQEFTPAPANGSAMPSIPDHELLRVIGRGSYGEVWLARSVTGALRAVKVVQRSRLGADPHFEREFAGLLNFEPVSRSHPGLVNILHVGRNDATGCFYYVMELADDAEERKREEGRMKTESSPTSSTSVSSFCIHTSYVPRTLRCDLERRGRLSLNECLQIGLALTSALEHLHRHGLIHRDIKPSNIIFVGGLPKLADIGLVAAVDEAKSFVGTEGFIPPEGPGTPQADLFSLGRVLYEVCTGLACDRFPARPSHLENVEEEERWLGFFEIVLKASSAERSQRYLSAQTIHTDLLRLLGGQVGK